MAKTLHSVIDKVYSLANLIRASKRVCDNKGAGGLDGMTVEQWRAHELQNIRILRRLLLEDRYQCRPVKRRYIKKKGSNKLRPLGIPDVSERVCQMAVVQQLQPTFEKLFHKDSFGYRPSRGTQQAADRVEALRKEGYRFAVDLDIEAFFDNVDHEIMLRLVRQVVKDRRVLALIRGWLKSGVMEEGKLRYLTSGTPQGGVISPLLSNIYLTPFDRTLEAAGYTHVRYADDVVILCRSREEAQSALAVAVEALGRLKLRISAEKTKVTSFQEAFDFLGFKFKTRSRGIGEKSLKAFYEKVREVTKRRQGDRPVGDIITNLNPVVNGWGRYHRVGQNCAIFGQIDKWVRNRVRAYVRQRWRDRGRNKLLSAEELAEKGLTSLAYLIRAPRQLSLFRGPP